MNAGFVRSMIWLFLFVVFIPSHNAMTSSEARYEIAFLPAALDTPKERMEVIIPADMNDLGQVTGRAMGALGIAGFLYTPGQGMKYIDPSGFYGIYPWRVNNAGQVVGRDMNSARYSLFLYDPLTGYQSLTSGLVTSKITQFGFHDMNDSGVILASAAVKEQGRVFPYRYTPGVGWQDLTNVYAALRRFRSRGFSPTHINERGDIAFYASEQKEIHSYIYLVESNSLASLDPVLTPGAMNDMGWVVGTEYKFSDPPVIRIISARGYLYTPQAGMKKIVPPGSGQSTALWIAADGTVGGCVEKAGYCGALFTFSKEKGYKIVPEAKLKALLPAGMPYFGISVISMNDRKEFAGAIVTEAPDGSQTETGYFLYSSKGGLVDIQAVVRSLRPKLKVRAIEDINNRGQLLLTVSGEDRTAAILTPIQ